VGGELINLLFIKQQG